MVLAICKLNIKMIEFQKRCLTHSHIALRVEGGGPSTPEEMNKFVRATIP